MPIPSAISIPFYIGTYIALDFCVGAVILLLWRMRAPESAAKFGIVTGAGLMVGDGLWQLPFGILGIAKVTQVGLVAPSRPHGFLMCVIGSCYERGQGVERPIPAVAFSRHDLFHSPAAIDPFCGAETQQLHWFRASSFRYECQPWSTNGETSR